jgi:hypothetical protein
MDKLNLHLDLPPVAIGQQVEYLDQLRKQIDANLPSNISVVLDKGTDQVMIHEIYKTLLSVKINEQAEARKKELEFGLINDFSLESCIAFIRAEQKTLMQSGLNKPENQQFISDKVKTAYDRRLKFLIAVENNLQTMNVFAARMAERLAGLPENSIRVEETKLEEAGK